MKKILNIVLAAILILSPFSVFAQTAINVTSTDNGTTQSSTASFAANGIYGCNQTSAAASSVGVFAGSGTYVPVNDAAVTLNTGYLVYLNCTLNPLVSSLSRSATAGIVQKILTGVQTGNNGGPLYSVNLNTENANLANTTALQFFQGGTLQNVNTAIRSTVQTSVARGYAQAAQQPGAVLNCNINDLNDLLNGAPTAFNWNDFNTLIYNPACNPMGAAQLTSDQLYASISNCLQTSMTQLKWGSGVYPVTTNGNPCTGNVVTPAAIVLNQEEQALQAGLTVTENSTQIGQMVSAMFAGIGAQTVTGAQGLAGITQSTGGQPSFINQVVGQTGTAAQQNATNAGITTLNGVIQTLASYINALTSIANTLINTSNALKSAENQCWNTIIQNVCTSGSLKFTNGSPTCSEAGSTGTTLHIATSTQFSNAVIQSQVNPLGQQTATQLQSAQNIQSQVNQLAAGITSSSQATQTATLQQLDQLTASNSFPQTSAIQNAQQQASSVGTSMQTLVNQVVQNWEGFDSNGVQDLQWDGTVSANTVGWCNYNNQPTLQAWKSAWSGQAGS